MNHEMMLLRLCFIVVSLCGISSSGIGHGSSSSPSQSPLIAELSHKIATQPMPLFEFGRDISKIVQEEHDFSQIEVENLICSYMEKIRDHYFEQFTSTVKKWDPKVKKNEYVILKERILRESNAAMSSAIPASLHHAISTEVHAIH